MYRVYPISNQVHILYNFTIFYLCSSGRLNGCGYHVQIIAAQLTNIISIPNPLDSVSFQWESIHLAEELNTLALVNQFRPGGLNEPAIERNETPFTKPCLPIGWSHVCVCVCVVHSWPH